MRQHSERVRGALSALINDRERITQAAMTIMRADNGNMFPLDIVAMFAAKRAISTASAFRLLIENWNLLNARAVLRTHIDTPIRFYAFSLVDDPHALAGKVLGGEHIRRIKDRDGKLMTDSYLVKKLGAARAWLPDVYDRLSGYIHLSSEHLGMTARHQADETLKVILAERDEDMPEDSWLEVLGCFHETTDLFVYMLESWAVVKNNARQRS